MNSEAQLSLTNCCGSNMAKFPTCMPTKFELSVFIRCKKIQMTPI